MPARICCARRPSSRPLIPGMTTSVSKRSTFVSFCSRMVKAAWGLDAAQVSSLVSRLPGESRLYHYRPVELPHGTGGNTF
jgi:hypothetical protein